MRTAIYIIAFIVLSIGIAFAIRSTNFNKKSFEKTETKKDKDKTNDKKNEGSSELTILKKWDVPEVLKEISALVYMDQDRFACIQDEDGKIFIYNTKSGKIEKEIPFGDAGDYEGLAIAGQNAFVLRSDGHIFEVQNFNGPKPGVVEHSTHLTAKNNPEALCYDSKNNRLLVGIKGNESNSDDYKGIYAFNLSDFKMAEAPVFKIDLTNSIFDEYRRKKKGSEIQPSAIAIHPVTGDIYITEATKPKLLILDSSGTIKTLIKLKGSDFNQPEGISFSPDGRMYISNEGSKKEAGNIMEVERL